MKNLYRAFKFPFFFTILLTLAACGDSGGGGGGGFTPTLPANALRVTMVNAGDAASSAVGSIDTMSAMTDGVTDLGLKAATSRPSMVEITQWVMRRAIREQFLRRQNLAARVVSENCGASSADGRIVGETNESGDRVSAELRFEECSFFGLVLDGQINLNGTFNELSGDYNVRFNGQLSITFGSEPTVTLTFNSHETGNEFSGAFTLGCAISIAGPPDTGFLLETTDDLSGNHLSDEIDEGELMLYGANNSRLRITVVSTNFVDIDIDEGSGSFSNYADNVSLDSL